MNNVICACGCAYMGNVVLMLRTGWVHALFHWANCELALQNAAHVL